MTHDRELEWAILYLQNGEPIPADLAAILMERGYIIEELEKEYSN